MEAVSGAGIKVRIHPSNNLFPFQRKELFGRKDRIGLVEEEQEVAEAASYQTKNLFVREEVYWWWMLPDRIAFPRFGGVLKPEQVSALLPSHLHEM